MRAMTCRGRTSDGQTLVGRTLDWVADLTPAVSPAGQSGILYAFKVRNSSILNLFELIKAALVQCFEAVDFVLRSDKNMPSE
jgi:hypothetical protein